MAIVVSILGACATESVVIEPFTSSGKADGGGKKLRELSDHGLDIDEPSDLAFVGGRLHVVSDRHSKLYAITRKGRLEDTVDIEGSDLEALASGRDTLVVGGESDDSVWFLTSDGHRIEDWKIDGADEDNSGIEGLAFDDDGHLFVAKEKDPARIIELDDKGEQVERTNIDFADDLSALSWNPEDGRLYAISDAERALYRLDRDLDVDDAWHLPIDHPEGLAFDGDHVFIASDSEERLYVFELD